MRRSGTVGEKLAEVWRRSPKDGQALEVLIESVLDRLDEEHVADPNAYVWKCDQPKPEGGA